MRQVFTNSAEKLLDKTLPEGWAEHVRDTARELNPIDGDLHVKYQSIHVPIPHLEGKEVVLFRCFEFDQQNR